MEWWQTRYWQPPQICLNAAACIVSLRRTEVVFNLCNACMSQKNEMRGFAEVRGRDLEESLCSQVCPAQSIMPGILLHVEWRWRS